MEGDISGGWNPKFARFELTGYQNRSELYQHIDCDHRQPRLYVSRYNRFKFNTVYENLRYMF